MDSRFLILVGIGSKISGEYRLLDVKEAAVAAAPHSKKARKLKCRSIMRSAFWRRFRSLAIFRRENGGRLIAKRQDVARELRPQDSIGVLRSD